MPSIHAVIDEGCPIVRWQDGSIKYTQNKIRIGVITPDEALFTPQVLASVSRDLITSGQLKRIAVYIWHVIGYVSVLGQKRPANPSDLSYSNGPFQMF